MSFLTDAMRVRRSKSLAAAVVIGTTISMAGAGPAQAEPSASASPMTIGTPTTEDCWWCDPDVTDTAYDDFGFADDHLGEWPFERPTPTYRTGFEPRFVPQPRAYN